MTIPDVIDEVLTELGADSKRVEEARRISIALHCESSESKERIKRDLTDDEVKQYKVIIYIYLTAVITNPELREQLHKEIESKLRKN
jgi:hypothetical protein